MHFETERLLLREFVEGDWRDTHEYERDPEVARHQNFEPRTPEESREYIVRGLSDAAKDPRATWDMAITLRGAPRVVGRCGLHVTNPALREGTLWYVLHRAHWGKGYVPEASRALLRFGFETLDLHRVTIDLDPRNHASIRVAEKLGMRREAHLIEAYWHKGEWADTYVFAMLGREWPTQS